MLKVFKVLVAAAALVAPSIASAGPVSVSQVYGFSFSGVGSSLNGIGGGFVPPSNPVGIDPGDGPWTFTLDKPGTLTVLDLFLSTDEFEIFNFGSSLGATSTATAGGTCGSDYTCALGDTRYSRGVFSLTAGSYSITGTQTVGTGGAGAFQVEPIPLPAGVVLMASGLAVFAGLRRFRKS